MLTFLLRLREDMHLAVKPCTGLGSPVSTRVFISGWTALSSGWGMLRGHPLWPWETF